MACQILFIYVQTPVYEKTLPFFLDTTHRSIFNSVHARLCINSDLLSIIW